jgi:hypothetical protein
VPLAETADSADASDMEIEPELLISNIFRGIFNKLELLEQEVLGFFPAVAM